MSSFDAPTDGPSPGVDLRKVIELCDRLARSWEANRPERIEDLLEQATGVPRADLLRELLAVELEMRRAQGEFPDPAALHSRFPSDPAAVEAAFLAADPPPTTASGSKPTPDEIRRAADHVVFGVVAYHNQLISREELVAAFRAWIADKSLPLSQILVRLGFLDDSRRAVLEALVGELIKRHSGDPLSSLARFDSIGSVRGDLSRLGDASLAACLAVAGRSGSESQQPRGGRFRILRLHAEGGLGRVYEAHDEEFGRKVAVKEIRPEVVGGQESRARFLLEAEINGGLQHPGIVPVYSLGSYDDGQPYYAMRFVEGASLKEAVAEYYAKNPDPDPNAKNFRKLLNRFQDVCDAIDFAHSRGVLHRDLKPHNVMIGDYGEALIIDWGLAKATGKAAPSGGNAREEAALVPNSGSAIEPTMGVIGTPIYMSPEQAAGQFDRFGPATDVYGLGAILYHILTGRAPIQGGDRAEVLQRVIQGEIKPPRSLNHRIPASLEAICLKALAREPGDRYASARDLNEDLSSWLADEAVTARRDSLLEMTGRWLRHHRVLSMTGLAALVVGVIGLALVNSANRKTHQAEKLAWNTQLEKMRVERLNIALRFRSAATSMRQRGNWPAALVQLDSATKFVDAQDMTYRMERLQVLTELMHSKGDQFHAELERMESDQKQGIIQLDRSAVARLILWRTEYEAMKSGGVLLPNLAYHDGLRKALDSGLEGADKFVAQGILESNILTAIKTFEQALSVEPFARSPRVPLVVCLAVAGRLEEAGRVLERSMAIYPDDVPIQFCHAIWLILMGKSQESQVALQKIRDQVGADSFVGGIAGFTIEADQYFLTAIQNGTPPGTPAQSVKDVAFTLFKKMMPIVLAGNGNKPGENLSIPIPVCVQTRFRLLFQASLTSTSVFDRLSKRTLFPVPIPTPQEMIIALEEELNVASEASLQSLHSILLMDLERYEEAEKSAYKATQLPHFLELLRRTYVFNALFFQRRLCDHRYYAENSDFRRAVREDPRAVAAILKTGTRNDPSFGLRVAEMLQLYAKFGDPRPGESPILFDLAIRANDLELARSFQRKWKAESPDDPNFWISNVYLAANSEDVAGSLRLYSTLRNDGVKAMRALFLDRARSIIWQNGFQLEPIELPENVFAP